MKSATTLGAAALAALMALSMTACGAASNAPRHNTANNGAYGQAYNGTEPYRYSPAADNKGNARQDLRNAGADMGRAIRDTASDVKDAAQNIAGNVTETGRDIADNMTGNAGRGLNNGIADRNTYGTNSTLGVNTAKNPNLTGLSGTK